MPRMKRYRIKVEFQGLLDTSNGVTEFPSKTFTVWAQTAGAAKRRGQKYFAERLIAYHVLEETKTDTND